MPTPFIRFSTNPACAPAPRGAIILVALLFFAIFTLLATSMLSSAVLYDKVARHSLSESQALALAEAGIDEATSRLNQSSSYTGETNTALGAGTFTVAISTIDSSTKLVSVTSYIPNSTNPISSKTVKAKVAVSADTVSFRYGVQSGAGGFTLGGGSTVNGSIYSNGSISATSGARITGSATAANPPSLTADQANNTPATIASCTSSTCITFGNASATQDFAQSFAISTANQSNSVQFYLKKVGSPSDATVRVVTDNSGAPSTNVLLTGTLSASTVTTSFGWVSVTLPTSPVLDPSQTYWLVIDAGNSSSNYYVIGANSGGYASGTAKIGQYGSTWSATTPTGLDGYFAYYLGGGTSMIGGNSYTTGAYVGTGSSDDAWAHTLMGVTVSGTAYCQNATFTSKSCTTSRADPTAAALAVSDANMDDWETTAAAGGTLTGDQHVDYHNALLGPKKIVGNLIVDGGGTLTLSGPLWVTGTVTVTGGGKIALASSFGTGSSYIISDGYMSLSGGGSLSGSGQSGSYLIMMTTSACPAASGCSGNNAITLSGGTSAVGLVAPDGTAYVTGGVTVKTVSAKQVTLDSGATLNYDTGLANTSFSSTSGGSWTVQSGSYAISN